MSSEKNPDLNLNGSLGNSKEGQQKKYKNGTVIIQDVSSSIFPSDGPFSASRDGGTSLRR